MAGIVVAAAVTAAAAYATSRTQQHEAKVDQQHEMAKSRQIQVDAKAQQEATTVARAQRAQQQSMAGGGYGSTIATSPLGLAGGTQGKNQLGA